MHPTLRQCFLSVFILAITVPRIAMADHLDAFVQVTCVPVLSYFAIRTFHIWNTDAEVETRGTEVRRTIGKDGVFTLEDFSHKSPRCVLPSHDISFQVSYHPSIGGRALENARIEFLVDEQSVYSFDAYGFKQGNLFHEDAVHQLEFPGFDDSRLLDCVYPEGKFDSPDGRLDTGGAPVTASCNVIKF
jgi:hypothetical protein